MQFVNAVFLLPTLSRQRRLERVADGASAAGVAVILTVLCAGSIAVLQGVRAAVAAGGLAAVGADEDASGHVGGAAAA